MSTVIKAFSRGKHEYEIYALSIYMDQIPILVKHFCMLYIAPVIYDQIVSTTEIYQMECIWQY